MDNQMNTPIITSLVLDNEPPNSTRPKPTPPWHSPFLELLGFLKVIDGSQSTCKADGQRVCIQPSHDLSEISRVFLSVSTSSSAQYDIDIKTIRLSGSDAVPPAVNKLQEYANRVLRRIQVFRDRLLERAVINDATCFLHVDLFTCPLCLGPLASCVDCDSKVACLRPTCRGSLTIDCELCYEHERMSCHACLAENDTVASLVCCPMCQGWCCREDMDWCAGLITHPALGTEELVELFREGDWDSETIVRSHPPKPGPCRFCTHHELAQGWAMCRFSDGYMEDHRCPSQTPFMTQLSLRAAHCPECVGESPGYRCACGLGWLCDTCSAIGNKSTYFPFLITCPRCGVIYCTHPERSCEGWISLCRGCKGVVLCIDCQEEEELPGDIQTETERPKQVVITTKCSYCEAWSCPDCRVSERTVICFLCDEWFCYSCASDPDMGMIERCHFCNGYICTDCTVHHQGCPGAVTLRNMLPPYLDTF